MITKHFGTYSQYYDVLYQDKDYEGEAQYVLSLMSRFGGGDVESVLELGCGTGRHAELLARSGLEIIGVELSKTMMDEAQRRAAQVNAHSKGRFEPYLGDARSFQMDRQFDSVLSLFHVVSYQTTNHDVQCIFANAVRHLKPGGVFIFDVWYGPAVLSMQPSVRIKRMESQQVQIVRIAEPEIDVNLDRVDVNYTVYVTDKCTGTITLLKETHPMRFFFGPELELLAEQSGMRVIHSEEWLSAASPSDQTWGVCFVARRA